MNKYSKEVVEAAVNKSDNYAEVFLNLGKVIHPGSYPWLKSLIQRFGISIDHFYKKGSETNHDIKKRMRRGSLKRLLLETGIKEKCCECGLNEWRGKSIRLDIDHIDKDPTNNNVENLQFLCPNCHRQKTVDADNPKPTKTNICSCGALIAKNSLNCKRCRTVPSRIEWPNNEDLKHLVWAFPLIEVGKSLGVSGNAVKKYCDKNNIPRPQKGYWTLKSEGRALKGSNSQPV